MCDAPCQASAREHTKPVVISGALTLFPRLKSRAPSAVQNPVRAAEGAVSGWGLASRSVGINGRPRYPWDAARSRRGFDIMTCAR